MQLDRTTWIIIGIIALIIIIIIYFLFLRRNNPSPNPSHNPNNSSPVNQKLSLYNIGQTAYQFNFMKVINLSEGTGILFMGQDMIVITKPGKIYLVENYQSNPEIQEIKAQLNEAFTSEGMENGLLGIAQVDDKIYLSYTTKNGSGRGVTLMIDEFMLNDELVWNRNLLSIPFRTDVHHGGHLVSKERYLYLGTGDGGPQNDPDNNAQNPATLQGKIIQIDPNTGQTKILALGLRQPWLFSFDSRNRLWIGDVGWDTSESIKVMETFDRLYNFGWSYYEGTVPNKPAPENKRFDPPIWEYPTSDETGRSVIGGFYLDQPAIYVFADYLGYVRAIKLIDNKWLQVAHNKLPNGKIFALARNGGQIYILADNGIYRFQLI